MIFTEKRDCTDIALITPIASSTSLVSFKPFIEMAEQWFCSIPLGLNRELFNWFNEQFNGTIDPGDQAKYDWAIGPLQKTIAWYAYYKFLEQNAVKATDSGNVVYTNNLTSQPTDKQFNTQLYAAKRNAYDALEYLIYSIFVRQSGDYSQFELNKALMSFVHSPVQWRLYHAIAPEGKLETYIELLPFIKMVESNFEEKIIGEDYYTILLDKWRNEVINPGALDAKEVKLIDKISRAVVFHAHRIASPFLSARLTPYGNKKESRQSEDNSTNEMNNLIDENNKIKDAAILAVWDYLSANKDFFTEWASSDLSETPSNSAAGGAVYNSNETGAISI